MKRSSGKEDGNPHRLLDLIPSEREWLLKSEDGGRGRNHGCSDDKKLELRLGLPGYEEESWSNKNSKPKEREELISFGHFTSVTQSNSSNRNNNASCSQDQKQAYPSPWGYAKESSRLSSTSMDHLPQGVTDMKNKAFSPPSANTAVPNSSQKRAAPASVVGWPPIRSFRKNLASSSAAKSVPDPPSAAPSTKAKEKPTENCHKGFFVKIKMDGVPIGRKVDLSAYDSYEKLSSAIDMLFRGLLAAQRDFFACGIDNKQEEKAITGLLDGTGEYTLVYEDNEGDRMLAGDVPWHMFVSTVKRLRVLRSSELATLNKARGKEGKLTN